MYKEFISEVIPKCIKNNQPCELHKGGHYYHWKCGKYKPEKRHEIYIKNKVRCIDCGAKICKEAKRCRKCQGKISGELRKGMKLPKKWCNNISKGQQGKKGNNWQGGKTALNKIIRESAKFNKWRMAVFSRDNWTCQKCGHRNKKGVKFKEIHPHHIKRMKDIIEENDIKTFKDTGKCIELWDVSNGCTLCVDCHRLTDSYGKN